MALTETPGQLRIPRVHERNRMYVMPTFECIDEEEYTDI